MNNTVRRAVSLLAVTFAGLAFIATSPAIKESTAYSTKLTLSAASPSAQVRFRFSASEPPVLHFTVPEGHRATLDVDGTTECSSSDGTVTVASCRTESGTGTVRSGTATLSITALNPSVAGTTIEVLVRGTVSDTNDSFVTVEAL